MGLRCAAVYALVGAGAAEGGWAQAMHVSIDAADASYTITADGLNTPVLRAGIAAEINGEWVRSSQYPVHRVEEIGAGGDKAGANGDKQAARGWVVTFSGLAKEPELVYRLQPSGDGLLEQVQATVRNTTGTAIEVEAIRMMESVGDSVLELGGAAAQDRVLSDSFSEDTPELRIRDLMDAGKDSGKDGHRAVGSQLIYNRASGWSFFAGAATTERFLTLLRLKLKEGSAAGAIAGYAAESTGTTEILRENALAQSPAEDAVALSLQVEPGAELASEQLLFSVDRDYHRQLEAYGAAIRELHHARVGAPVAMGWWSWTAYYYGLNEATALTNAQWLAQNLSSLGYDFFHIDEGYQSARGEYATEDARLFPHGMTALESKVRSLGLVPGLWVAPFEVSERSWVFAQHPEWLVENAKGLPIHIGWANNHHDRLYVLDVTNPQAQAYMRATYSTLVKQWGIRYLKLDFMDSSAVEGRYFRPGTTAMEAQRMGLEVIRESVGEDVLLDKDGSTMLNPVGYVDYGRIGVDTGHVFKATQSAGSAVAARYYMNRNFFVSDPDAFTVSTQTVKDEPWHGGSVPLSFEEAKVSIAVSAISGGMFEIGDDLPTLGSSAERLALVKNRELLNMVKLGEAATPVDLMEFAAEDGQPSIFVLKEDARQSVVTIFNWTEGPRVHRLELASLGLDPKAAYEVEEIFGAAVASKSVVGEVSVSQPAHSVRMLRLVNAAVPVELPKITVQPPEGVKAGEAARFAARSAAVPFPPFEFRWSFGDGVEVKGASVEHAYTHAGTYVVELDAVGLDGTRKLAGFDVTVTGSVATVFVPAAKMRSAAK
jgi:alpha-galactosidase